MGTEFADPAAAEPCAVTVGHRDGMIVIQSDGNNQVEPNFLTMPPDTARDLAVELLELADACEGIEHDPATRNGVKVAVRPVTIMLTPEETRALYRHAAANQKSVGQWLSGWVRALEAAAKGLAVVKGD